MAQIERGSRRRRGRPTSCLRRSNLKLGDVMHWREMSCDVQELAGDACAPDITFGTEAHASNHVCDE